MIAKSLYTTRCVNLVTHVKHTTIAWDEWVWFRNQHKSPSPACFHAMFVIVLNFKFTYFGYQSNFAHTPLNMYVHNLLFMHTHTK